jgi:DNA repair exonuclease SbcCD ATPase subunit
MTNDLIEIKKKLQLFVKKEKQNLGLNNLLLFFQYACLIILFSLLIEAVFNLETVTRTIFFFIVLGVFFSLFVYFVLYPFLKDLKYSSNPDYIDTANRIGNHYPEIKDELANAIQIMEEEKNIYSGQLINAAFKNIFRKTNKLDFEKIIDHTKVKKNFKNTLISIAATALLIIFVPGLNSAAYHLINFHMNFAPAPKFIFIIQPGNANVTKDDNITILIKTIGDGPREINFFTKSEEQTEYITKNLIADSLGYFRYESSSVKNSFEYFASADKITSETYKISVVNRPIISNFEVTIIPPAYSHLPEQIQKDNGNISALPGSKIKMNLNSSLELLKAFLIFSDSTIKDMDVRSAKANTEFQVKKEINYRMQITDIQNNTNLNPIEYFIKPLIDEPPSIEMISPNQNIKLSTNNRISLAAKIKDDYGFSKLNLNYRLSASKYRKVSEEFTQIPIKISGQLNEENINYLWDVSSLILAEGEVVSYYLEVFDNDNINGPKPGKTSVFTITVPSLDELFVSSNTKQEDASKDLSETMKDAEVLNKEMQKISDDLKQNKQDISWKEKERIQKAADNFKEISKKINEVSKKLSEAKDELSKNNLLSDETLKKYNELQKLLNEMNSDELKQALERMQNALKSLLRDNVEMSMEQLKANEEYFKKSLERILNLLKRIQTEQKVEELIKRTEELAKKAEELKKKTNEANISEKQKRDELSNRQKDITEDTKQLKNEIDNLDSKMNDLKDMPKDQMHNIEKDFEKQDNQNLSQKAQNSLQQMEKQSAMQNQQNLSQNMQNLNKQFQDMQSSMQRNNQMKEYYEMLNILEDLISLSKDQEKLKNETEQLSPNSPELKENSHKQNSIQSNLNKVMQKMSALSQKSFSVTPEMGNELGKASSEMQQSLTGIQNHNIPFASQNQKNAMKALNEAASLMKNGMNQMMTGGQGGGMMSLMQQLQNLSMQQMNLNQLTQMMNQGQMSQEMMSQMQRLSQQQEMLRKSLEQLNKETKESGKSKSLAENLDQIEKEMKEVVTNFQTQKLNDDLVKKQDKILSKLLDAQKSITEHDYEKERKSTSGKDFNLSPPPEIILSTEEGRNKLKDELMKSIREGYKKDYEELIREYFNALENEDNNESKK